MAEYRKERSMEMRSYTMECDINGVVTVKPMPSPEELEAFYADVYFQQPPSSTFATQYTEEELEHRRLRAGLVLFAIARAEKGSEGQASFLEIGCGEGFLLQAAMERDYSVMGIDYSDEGLRTFIHIYWGEWRWGMHILFSIVCSAP